MDMDVASSAFKTEQKLNAGAAAAGAGRRRRGMTPYGGQAGWGPALPPPTAAWVPVKC